MKKVFLLVSFFIVAIFCAVGQTPKVSVKWETELNKNLQGDFLYNSYLGEDENSYYILVRELKQLTVPEYQIEKIDKKTLKPKGTKKVDNFKGAVKNVFYAAGKPYVLVWTNASRRRGFINIDTKNRGLFNNIDFDYTKNDEYAIYEFDVENQTLIPMKNSFSEAINPFDKDFITVVASPDSSKILFAYPPRKGKKSETNSYRMVLQDRQGNKLWEKEVKTNLSFKEDLRHYYDDTKLPYILYGHSFALGDDGTVYISGIKFYSDRKETFKVNLMERDNFDYFIEKIPSESTESKQFKVAMNNLYYHKLKIALTKNNKLFAVGFYSSESDKTKAGVYYFSMNEEFTQAQEVTYKEIPINILYTGVSRASDMNSFKRNVDLRCTEWKFGDVMLDKNGDMLLCAEANSGMTLYSRDIYVFKITEENGLQWVKRIPKWQDDSDLPLDKKREYHYIIADRLGYFALLEGDNLVLFFVDNLANMNVKEDTERSGIKRAIIYQKQCQLVSVTLDKNGAQKKQKVSGMDNLKLSPEIRNAGHISNSKVILPARYYGKCKVGIISVGE